WPCCTVALCDPPQPPLFPYTTLFRSVQRLGGGVDVVHEPDLLGPGGVDVRSRVDQLGDVARSDDPWKALEGAHVGDDGQPRLARSEEHTSELQSRENLVCRLLLEKKN